MKRTREEIVAARLRLRERFIARMQVTPGVSDARPLGSGPKNRHGMPKIPIDQTPAAPGKWPVLDLGAEPRVTRESFRLRVDGACRAPYTLDFAGLLELEQVDDVSDFHCVTGWSLHDLRWTGVRLNALLALARPRAEATHVMLHGRDGYSANLPLEEALKDDVLVARELGGKPLPVEHGGPARVVVPQLWAWKGAKWLSRIELMPHDRRGYWEIRGYSNTAYPWRDDRMW